MALLAEALRFPLAYFFRPIGPRLSPDSVSFRAFSRLTASDRDSALVSAQTAAEFNALIEQHLELPKADLPDLRDFAPADAAAVLRSSWSLGLDPVPNLIHLLEAHGVRVFALPDEFSALDAFCTWEEGVPFVFLTRSKSPERGRWDAAHELGHLVLHLHGPPHGRQLEQEADEFAREFLLPSKGVDSRRIPLLPSLATVKVEKIWWGVSAMAYIRQLKEMKPPRLTEWQYRSLIIQATQAGYRKSEGDIERETSGLLPQALKLLAEDGLTVRSLAEELQIESRELAGLLFLPLHDVPGAGETSPKVRGHLHLVEEPDPLDPLKSSTRQLTI